MQSEYGLYYRLPRPLLEMLEVEQSDEEDEEDEESGAASIDPGAAEKTAVEPEGELPTCEIVDKMRVMYKEKAMTVRTRDGTGDSAIAVTKVGRRCGCSAWSPATSRCPSAPTSWRVCSPAR